MNDRPPSPSSDRAAIRAQAAYWCSRMNGDDSAQYQEQFEQWLSRSPVHRSTFSEYSELLSYAETIDMHPPAAPGPAVLTEAARTVESNGRPRGRRYLAYVATLVIALVSALFSVWFIPLGQFESNGKSAAVTAYAHLETPLGTIRAYRLNDGSRVTLDTMSEVEVSMTQDGRTLHLLRGRARFDVAHGQRPFTVTAGSQTIRALGTIFDVSIEAARGVRVELLRGAISVRSNGNDGGETRPIIHKLTAGEAISFAEGQGTLKHQPISASGASNWPSGLTTFEGVSLKTVIGQANRYASVKLRLADPAMDDLPVYGTLKLDRPRPLATILARSLDLELTDAGGEIILSTAK